MGLKLPPPQVEGSFFTVTVTLLILELLVAALSAILFWLDMARSCSLGITSSFGYHVQAVPHASV